MRQIHTWNVSPKEAIEIQKKLRSEVSIKPFLKPIRYIAGADISLNRFSDIAYAGIIVLSYPDLTPVTHSLVKSRITFPYVPGLLSFREIPSLLEVWEKLSIKPDVLVVDGQGIAHPRRLGIATHLGLFLDVPTVGCAKSPLFGVFDEPGVKAGDQSFIYDKYNPKEVIGVALRTKERSKPVIISPGNNISLEESVEIIKQCSRGYRIPEPIRLAHELVNAFRRGEIE